MTTPASPQRLLLGAYTPKIYDVDFTPPTPISPPTLEVKQELDIGPDASWLAVHPTHPDIWYAAIENEAEPAVGVYRVGSTVEELGRLPAIDLPCHVEVVGSATGLAVSNFVGGSYFLVPLRPDGTFDAEAGTTPNYIKMPARKGPTGKAHQAVDVPARGEVFVVDSLSSGIIRMKLATDAAGRVTWSEVGFIDTLLGHGPRQFLVSADARHLYMLHARSCLVTHQDLSDIDNPKLVSQHQVNPEGHHIDMATKEPMSMPIAAALTLHAASSTLTATSRLLPGESVDSIAFYKLQPDGGIEDRGVLRPQRGREFRGVGFVEDCFLVAGQTDDWISCFQWDANTDSWSEKPFDPPVKMEKVVDIKICSVPR